jgi:hypothetical protein
MAAKAGFCLDNQPLEGMIRDKGVGVGSLPHGILPERHSAKPIVIALHSEINLEW